MLTNLKIAKFRGLNELSLTDTGRVNLIVGRNDTGKTSLLEAIRLLLSGDPRHLKRKARNSVARTRNVFRQDYQLAFYQIDSGYCLQIEGQIGGTKLTLQAEICNVEKQEQLPIDLDSDDDTSDDADAIEDGESLLQPSQEIVVKVTANDNATAVIRHPLQRSFPVRRRFTGEPFPTIPTVVWLGTDRAEVWPLARSFSDLFRSGGSSTLIKLLQLLEPRLRHLVVLSTEHDARELSEAVLEADLGFEQTLPLDSMGDGFGSIIAILTAIGKAKGGLCLVDEVENGIHYSVLPNLWYSVIKAANEYDTQVWATTHSFDCINSIYEAFSDAPDSLRVHRLDCKPNGTVTVHTFDHAMLGHALETGLEIR